MTTTNHEHDEKLARNMRDALSQTFDEAALNDALDALAAMDPIRARHIMRDALSDRANELRAMRGAA